MKILITGGAGYIGSFMTMRLLDKEYKVVVIDSLERGYQKAIDKRAEFLSGNLLDKAFLKKVFESTFDAVIHFAGYISMGESMKDPFVYFLNNTFATLNLLEEMKNSQTKRIIFSSTAGVYGNPTHVPIPENHPKNPTNPYGESKLMTEKALQWYQKIYGISSISLRYFNACGGALDGSMGEKHNPETHIIPNAIKAAINNTPFPLFGSDYETDDGTCVRDYIHVLDLVEAHVLALEKLQKDDGGFTYNVGTGTGYSNKQVIEMVKKISMTNFSVTYEKRRLGDADRLIADPTKITKELGFTPVHSDLETIVMSAWEWHKKNAT